MWILNLLTLLWKGLFGKSTEQKLGEATSDNASLKASLAAEKAMHQAAVDAPKTKKSLLDLLRKGAACFLLFSLIACNTLPETSGHCPIIQKRTPEEQQELAKALEKVPENSPIMDMAQEWARLRAESTKCNNQ